MRKQAVIEFLTNSQQTEAFAQRTTFKSFQIFKQDLVSVLFQDFSVVLTQRTLVNASMLDFPMFSLCDFQCEAMVPLHSLDQLKVAHNSIDFRSNQIETPNMYENMASCTFLTVQKRSPFVRSD